MDIESVRALKVEVAEAYVRPLFESVITKSFGVPATSTKRMTGTRAGVALGVTRGETGNDYRLAVRVQRRALDNGVLREQLERSARGEIDYRYIGRLTKHQTPWYQSRQRPLLIGCSVGHFNITAGTLGAFALRAGGGRAVILSNNHVLADEDNGRIGDAILQQGDLDGGTHPGDAVGALLDFVQLRSSGNLVDAAIAEINEDIEFDLARIRDLGILAGMRNDPIEPGDRVAKVGRTTGLTRGIVTAIELDDVVVAYDKGDLSFDSQIEIEGEGDEAFSAGGDSGSLIVDEEKRGCALLFAGGDQGGTNGKGLTYANDLSVVLRELDISLAV